MKEYEKEMETAERCVLEAGRIVAASYERIGEGDVSEKHTNDLVTTTDVESQKLIVSIIRDAFPDDAIVAEETLAEGVNAGVSEDEPRRWYIDPLDGTTNYIHAFPMFAVSVALAVGGEPVLGVTYDPLRGDLFRAARGYGAWLGGKRLRVSRVKDPTRTLLGTGFPFRARIFLDDYLETFRHFFNNCRGVRRAGSATLDLAYVAAGRLDAFWELTLSPWDIAAGVVLVEEAGGRVTDFFGGRDFLATGHIVASNGLFHDWMLESIQKVFPPGGDYRLPEDA